jgi:hypothetical protein
MKKDNLLYLTGENLPQARPVPPYSEKACSFISALSESLISRRDFPDVASFAFFCRRANIARLKHEFYKLPEIRLGRGTVFHITPSNIPINFAFSLVFGLLSGNANVVRVPTKEWPQVDIVCKAINLLLERPEFSEFASLAAMVRYERDDEVTAYFSERCDARVIWGGDETVRSVRKIAVPPRAIEMTFADRYSFCVLDENAIASLGEAKLARLAEKFYNDTYLVDQNACSSPSLVVWLGRNGRDAREKFWRAVHEYACRYDLSAIRVMDKYSTLCDCLARDRGITGAIRMGNLLYRIELSSLADVESRRGRFGLFFEYETEDIRELAPCITQKWQTIRGEKEMRSKWS